MVAKGQAIKQPNGRLKTHVGHPIKYRKIDTVKDAVAYMREEDPRHDYGFRKVEGGYGIYKSTKRKR